MLDSILLPLRKNSVCSTVCDFKFNETKPILLFANTGVVPRTMGVMSILDSLQFGDLSTDPLCLLKKYRLTKLVSIVFILMRNDTPFPCFE